MEEAMISYNCLNTLDNKQPGMVVEACDVMIKAILKTGQDHAALMATMLTIKGKALFIVSEYAKAIEALQQSLHFFNGNALATLTLGDSYLASKDFKNAWKYFNETKVLMGKNDHAFAPLNLFDIDKRKAAVHAAMGNVDKTIKIIDPWANDGMAYLYGEEALCTRARYYAMQSRWNDMIADYTKVLDAFARYDPVNVKNRKDFIIAHVLEGYFLLEDSVSMKSMIPSFEPVECLPAGYSVLCRYLLVIIPILEGDDATAVAACVDLILQVPSPGVAWDFQFLDNHLETRIETRTKDFLQAMHRWLAGDANLDRIKVAAKAFDIDADAIIANLGSLTQEETSNIARMIHEDIMAISLNVLDENFKRTCSAIGDHMKYNGIILLSCNTLEVVFTSPWIYWHLEAEPDFENTLTYKELRAIDKAVKAIHEKYSEFVKGRGNIQLAATPLGEKPWLYSSGKCWTYVELPPSVRDVAIKNLGFDPSKDGN